MRKKNYKGRVTKRYLPKCNDICHTYDPIQTAYADLLSKREDIEEFRCNVYLEGITEDDFTTDFLCKKTDGTYMVRECVYRSRILKPMNISLLEISRSYWLHRAYVKMLNAKYCDDTGKLMDNYPSYYQFRYFYRKTKKLENYYISRNGLTNYQRNNRPCIGDNVRVYSVAPGVGMVDATVCDIYLVNECGEVVGRPILTARKKYFVYIKSCDIILMLWTKQMKY